MSGKKTLGTNFLSQNKVTFAKTFPSRQLLSTCYVRINFHNKQKNPAAIHHSITAYISPPKIISPSPNYYPTAFWRKKPRLTSNARLIKPLACSRDYTFVCLSARCAGDDNIFSPSLFLLFQSSRRSTRIYIANQLPKKLRSPRDTLLLLPFPRIRERKRERAKESTKFETCARCFFLFSRARPPSPVLLSLSIDAACPLDKRRELIRAVARSRTLVGHAAKFTRDFREGGDRIGKLTRAKKKTMMAVCLRCFGSATDGKTMVCCCWELTLE